MRKHPKKSFADSLRAELCKLFLHCAFKNPEFVLGEIEKHLSAPKDSVVLYVERNTTDANGNEISKHYKLSLFGVEFVLRYDKKTEPQREVLLRKIVVKPKKWWQIKPTTMVITEKTKLSESNNSHWVLNCIE